MKQIRKIYKFFLDIALMSRSFWSDKKDGTIDLFGKPFLVPDNDMRSFALLFWQIVEKNQYHVELIKKNGIVVDAGANIGIFSIFAAIKNPHATVYAFEPTPETFAALKENVKYYPNIIPMNYAIGESERNARLIINDVAESNYIDNGGVQSILRRINRFFRSLLLEIPIEMKTMDGMKTRVDFLKIDTEGYEANILNGARETIKKFRPIIVMSAYHNPGDKKELPQLLNSIAPYHCELRTDAEEDLVCKPI